MQSLETITDAVACAMETVADIDMNGGHELAGVLDRLLCLSLQLATQADTTRRELAVIRETLGAMADANRRLREDAELLRSVHANAAAVIDLILTDSTDGVHPLDLLRETRQRLRDAA